MGGGDDDDIVTQTPRTISRTAVFLGIYNTFVMSDHLLLSPDILLDFANSTLGFRRAFCENSNLDGGKLVSGMRAGFFSCPVGFFWDAVVRLFLHPGCPWRPGTGFRVLQYLHQCGQGQKKGVFLPL